MCFSVSTLLFTLSDKNCCSPFFFCFRGHGCFHCLVVVALDSKWGLLRWYGAKNSRHIIYFTLILQASLSPKQPEKKIHFQRRAKEKKSFFLSLCRWFDHFPVLLGSSLCLKKMAWKWHWDQFLWLQSQSFRLYCSAFCRLFATKHFKWVSEATFWSLHPNT